MFPEKVSVTYTSTEFIYVFIRSVVNYTDSSSDFTASNDRKLMTNEIEKTRKGAVVS
jgi:hypothetical protein